MPCTRGKASPDAHTKLQLWAASAGFCQNPACHSNLLLVVSSKERIHIAEMAHIAAAGDKGPRANTELTEAERGAFENLILLCPTCHTIIDKAPDTYPDSLIKQWKKNHATALDMAFGVQEYQTRREARVEIERLLLQNRTVFEAYGPHRDEHLDPESDMHLVWRERVRSVIIPNSQKIIRRLDTNRQLLSRDERKTLELFRQHVLDLTARHTEGEEQTGGLMFPMEMNDILEGR